jgi:hypothetical protein
VVLRIDQRWSTIRLTLESEKAFSSSEMATITQISPDEFDLRWEYHAEGTPGSDSFDHRGVTRLRFSTPNEAMPLEMRGDYYTQHTRFTDGTIELKRQPASLSWAGH